MAGSAVNNVTVKKTAHLPHSPKLRGAGGPSAEPLRGGGRTLLLGALFGYLTLGSRLQVRVEALEGRTVALLAPFLIIIVLVRQISAKRLAPVTDSSASFAAAPVPFFALALSLPVLGVVSDLYAPTSLYSLMGPVVLLSLATLKWASAHDWRGIVGVVYWAIIVHGVYGLGQMLFREGLLHERIWGWARHWDITSQSAIKEEYVIVGRSTGLFINPNVFGAWSVVAVVFSFVVMTGRRRAIGAFLGLLGIVASQSRTAFICLLVILLISPVASWGKDASTTVSKTLAATSFFGVPMAISAMLSGLGRFIEEGLVERVLSAWSVGSVGMEGDRNFSGRFTAWDESLARIGADSRLHGGTLGPPQVYTQHFIDNQYLLYYLQGGAFFLAAYLMLLASPLLLVRREPRLAIQLGAMSCVVAVASLTLLVVDATQVSAVVVLYCSFLISRRTMIGAECRD